MKHSNNTNIEPNKAIAPFFIGMEEDELFQIVPSNSPKIKIGGMYIIEYGSYKLWIESESRTLVQIGVLGNFSGSLFGKVRLGSTVKEVENSIGPLDVNDDFQLTLKNYPGVCFHTEPPISNLNPDPSENAIIDSIYVYKEQ